MIPATPALVVATWLVATLCGLVAAGFALPGAACLSLATSLVLIAAIRRCLADEADAPIPADAPATPASTAWGVQHRLAAAVALAWLGFSLACSGALAHIPSFDAVLALQGEGAGNPILGRARALYGATNPWLVQGHTRAVLAWVMMAASFLFWTSLGLHMLRRQHPRPWLLPVASAAVVSLTIGMGILINHTGHDQLRQAACNDLGMVTAGAVQASPTGLQPTPAVLTEQHLARAIELGHCSR